MTIVKCTPLEDCFDGSRVLEYVFDAAWSAESIERLAGLGELRRHRDFPRPLFQLRTPGGLVVKGVEGEAKCRAVLPRRDPEAERERFERAFPLP